MPAGRPTDYRPEMVEKVRQYFSDFEPFETVDGKRVANPPPMKIDIAKKLGVSRDAVWDWEKKHEEFGNAIKNGMENVYPEILQTNAMLGLYAQPFAIFSAKNRMGWHDRQEIRHDVHVEPMVIKTEEGVSILTLGSRINGNHVAQIPA